MSKTSEALVKIRRWACEMLDASDAGRLCGMLSELSRHVNGLEDENERLRKLVDALDQTPAATVGRDVCLGSFHRSSDLSSGRVPIYYCRVINKSIFVMRDATYCPLCGGRIEAER